MSVRKFAKSVGFEVVGNLKYMGYESDDSGGFKWWLDEGGNEYYKNDNGSYCIVDSEGGVL